MSLLLKGLWCNFKTWCVHFICDNVRVSFHEPLLLMHYFQIFFSSVDIAMEALDTLLVTCHAQSLNLFVESFLKMVQKLLECNDVDLQCLATASVCLMFIFDLLFWVWIILEIIFLSLQRKQHELVIYLHISNPQLCAESSHPFCY